MTSREPVKAMMPHMEGISGLWSGLCRTETRSSQRAGRGWHGPETTALVQRSEVFLTGEHHVGDTSATGLVERPSHQSRGNPVTAGVVTDDNVVQLPVHQFADEEEAIDRAGRISVEDDMPDSGPDGKEFASRAELDRDEIPDRPTGRFFGEDVLNRDEING